MKTKIVWCSCSYAAWGFAARQIWPHFHSSFYLMHNQIDAITNIGAKRFWKFLLIFRLQSALSNIKYSEQNSSDKMRNMCPTNNLPIAPALLLSLEKREKHSAPETGSQSAAVICHHPLANQPDPQVEASKRGNGWRSFCHLVLAPDQCSKYQYSEYSVGHCRHCWTSDVIYMHSGFSFSTG